MIIGINGSITSIIDTSTTSFIDTDIIGNQRYYYFIRSYNSFGQSQLSNIVNYSITSLGNYSVYIQDYQLEKTFEEYQDESFEISFNLFTFNCFLNNLFICDEIEAFLFNE